MIMGNSLYLVLIFKNIISKGQLECICFELHLVEHLLWGERVESV